MARDTSLGPAARLTRPIKEFLDTEVSGGIVLLVAVVLAMAWANSPWASSYDSFWSTDVGFRIGSYDLRHSLHDWVNDALMVLFFFVVGLEVKREFVTGELNTPRKAALPAIAALGGMIAPATIYLALAGGGDAARGWGVPIATDIALAVGVLALLGSRVPNPLRVLLLTLAIFDDIGAVLVIAVFYTESISWIALAIAAGAVAMIVVMRLLGVWWTLPYVLIGTVMWGAVLESGVHATIAGVILGLLAPARPRAGEHAPVTERLTHVLHPWTTFLVLPVFALANAGIAVGAGDVRAAAGSMVAIGIVAGLTLGKTIGITLASLAGVRLGLELPTGVTRRHVLGIAALAGIGFTMSLFIADLAFGSENLETAKIGIVAGSLIAAGAGAAILLSGRDQAGAEPQRSTVAAQE